MAVTTSARGAEELPDTIEAIEHYYRSGLTDGLPVVPPTPERVEQFLQHAGRRPDEVLFRIPARSLAVTAQKVAINSIMAGCLPEYAPVIATALEAMAEPPFNLHGSCSSTVGVGHLVIVHGPIARELDLNCSTNLFGPTKRSNATIGRAIRLVLRNACGSVPDLLDMAALGHPGKYSYCIAEDEEWSPWLPLHVDRGLSRETSAVTVSACHSPLQYRVTGTSDPKDVLASLVRNINFQVSFEPGDRGQMFVVLTPEVVGFLVEGGWSKKQIQEYLFEHTETVEEDGQVGRAYEEPGDLMIMVAGGRGGPYFCTIQAGGAKFYHYAITRAIAR